MKKILPCILVSVAAVASLPAMATSSTYHTAYNKGSSCGSGTTTTTSACPTFTMTSSGTTSANGVNVSAGAYYNTSGSTALNSAYSMTYYSGSGYGIASTSADGSSPEHAVDNNGQYEWIMLSFDKAVSLDEITLGWISGDADMTILASGGGSTDLTAWNFVENVYYGYNETPGQISKDSNDRTVVSLTNEICASHWLIGALNPAYDTLSTSSVNYIGNDYFKLYSVAACTDCTPPGEPSTGVPEPGSLALAGLGLLGMLGMRRRRS